MAKWNKMIYTDAGRNIIARASSGECQVEFTKAVIGDGTYTEGAARAGFENKNSIKE